MAITTKRVKGEIKKLKTGELPFGIKIEPREDDIFTWDAEITGGIGTPHEGLTYKLLVRIDKEDYPKKPPSIKFISKIYHPNVYRDGQICIDILQSEWTPTLRIISALISIQSMLDDPNPNSPANRDSAMVFMKDKELYKKKIQEYYKLNLY